MNAIPLYWWNDRLNVGDQLNPYLVRKITGNRVAVNRVEKYYQKEHYLCIGSILKFANQHSMVWGSGIISRKKEHLPMSQPAIIHAVRGPLTREVLKKKDINAPEIYGDPGILVSHFYKNKNILKEYEFGLIPHFVDINKKIVQKLGALENVKIINVLTDNVEHFVDDILSCDLILSSSLHGLILADSYQIPNTWVNLSDSLFRRSKIVGDGFKFKDYFETVNRSQSAPVIIRKPRDLIKADKQLEIGSIDMIIKDLIQASPF